MLKRLVSLFRGRAVLVPSTDRLAEGEARNVDIGDPLADGKQILLCRVDGTIHALDSVCPHEGGRIAPGPLHEGRLAVCPLHSYKFDPRTGACVGQTCRRAKTYRTRESGGDCEVWI